MTGKRHHVETSLDQRVQEAATWVRGARHAIAFTGAGISVESGIPPFRGENGLWERFDPHCVDIDYFNRFPDRAWPVLKEIFYDFMGHAKPNAAHEALAKLEEAGRLKWVITQNIDALHQAAGSRHVTEYHGTIETLHCQRCLWTIKAAEISWSPFPPVCAKCGGSLKPDFVFFGEMIPPEAAETSLNQAQQADLIIVVGSTGEVMPAAMLPRLVKRNGGRVIEVNPEPSNYTGEITDCFLQGKAGDMLSRLVLAVFD